MSMESAKAFLERMKTDEDFSKKVNECKGRDERISFVKKEGFDFTEDELKAETMELNDDELKDISGGSCFGDTACFVRPR